MEDKVISTKIAVQLLGIVLGECLPETFCNCDEETKYRQYPTGCKEVIAEFTKQLERLPLSGEIKNEA